MGKKKVDEPTLSKKERKALAKREAEIRAELERRAEEKAARKAAKKKAKKSKGKKSDDAPKLSKTEREAADAAKAARAEKRAKKDAASAVEDIDGAALNDGIAAAADLAMKRKAGKKSKRDEVIDPDTGKTRPEVIAERAAEREKSADEIDAAIKARLAKKRAAAAAADPDDKPGSAKRLKAMQDAATARREAPVASEPAQAAEAVETERGREFVVGESVAAAEDDDFAKPSESPKRWEDDTNGNGQYKVARPADGKVVGYTRVTTYIGCLEDTAALTKWKMRLLLEGVAAAEELGNDAFTAKVRDLVHRRDVAVAKARKADRKGKLGVGELATYVDGAWSDFKKAMDALADEAFELGGGREKAQKGTDIHELCALAVEKGIDAVGEKLEAGEITPADLADVEAFLDALNRLGAKVVGIEQVVVNDELKVAGRLDYILMLKLPGTQRASRVVADLKTGRVDYGTGKIAMQLGQYAEGTGYDVETHERTDLKLNRTKAILIHLPAGTAKATAHIVDLAAARRGNKLAAEVRAWRNEGKKAIDLKVDLLTAATDEAA